MRLSVVIAVIGQILVPYSLAFLPPLAFALAQWDLHSALSYVTAAVACWVTGRAMSWRFQRPRLFFRAEALAIAAGAWMAVATVSGIPYLFHGLSVVDAMFEAMSGLTTTGATIFSHFDYPDSLFLWRSLTQWFGGLGVLALSVVVLPRLGIAGRQLFFAEASTAPADAVSPQIRHSARLLWLLYSALTALCAVLLIATGMHPFDALCNSLTTLSAGGFSPNGESILGYHNPGTEWVLTVFMFLAGASFTLQLRAYTGEPLAFFRDGEFRFYLGATVATVGLLVPLLHREGLTGLDDLRTAMFQVTSLMSSTGFASLDYNTWSDSSRAILVIVMVIGGCAGSAAGGPKCVRHLLVLRHIFREVRQTLHPRAVLPLLYNGQRVTDPVLRAIFALVLLYFGGYLLLGVALTVIETDFVTAFSASVACLGNIGPGFEIVGPEGSYHSFSPLAKSMLFVAMWIGRLEILTVLALLHPSVWRSLRVR